MQENFMQPDEDALLGQQIARALSAHKRDTTTAWQRLAGDIARQPGIETLTSTNDLYTHRSPWMRLSPMRMVASGLGIGALCLLFVLSSKYIPAVNNGTKSSQVAQQTYATGPAERANLVVNETRVFLAPSTTLRASDGVFSLTGHAIFDVRHKADKPISIVANGVTTRVLGTIFSVRAYAGEGRTRISVKEGRVSVQPSTVTSGESIILSGDDEVSVTIGGQASRIHPSNLDDFAVASGRLVLREANVGEAFVELARWYGLEFRTSESSLLSKQITITLPQTLTNGTIQDIADVLGARAVRNGQTVTFEAKK